MIHVAIISHGHEDLLISSEVCGLRNSNEHVKLWIKDNCPSVKLKVYCHELGVAYIDARPGLGFGHNNNYLYDLIEKQAGFVKGDVFIVMNPDITITAETIYALVEKMRNDHSLLATINLYRDPDCKTFDANIRHFPNLNSLYRMLLLRSVTVPCNKHEMAESNLVDWASGAFLAFDAMHYSALNGFNVSYFMYFEDVDICYRSEKLLGISVRYYSSLRATHTAARKNRNLVSIHALWFFRSFLKFLAHRYFIYPRFEPPKAIK